MKTFKQLRESSAAPAARHATHTASLNKAGNGWELKPKGSDPLTLHKTLQDVEDHIHTVTQGKGFPQIDDRDPRVDKLFDSLKSPKHWKEHPLTKFRTPGED